MRKLFIITFVFFIGLTGCQEQHHKKITEPARQADLTLAGTARFLCSDGSWYLTQQKQEIFIKPEEMKLTAKEPSGEIILTVRNGKFAVQKRPAGVIDEELFNLMTDESICKAMLELYLAELKNLPSAIGQAKSLTLEGQVYDLVYRSPSGVEVYKNKSTLKNDLVISQGEKRRYILYGYNYLKMDKAGYFPSKIDVYVYNSGSDRKLVAQYDCRLL